MKATHKTHATAVYNRMKGDKRRPVKFMRPTLRQFAVTLRKIKRGVRNAQGALRSKDASVQFQGRAALAALYGEQNRINQYFKAIANA